MKSELPEEFDESDLKSVVENPFGMLGRRLYRAMMKQWPKPEESYDWVYEPGQLELTPISSVESLHKG